MTSVVPSIILSSMKAGRRGFLFYPGRIFPKSFLRILAIIRIPAHSVAARDAGKLIIRSLQSVVGSSLFLLRGITGPCLLVRQLGISTIVENLEEVQRKIYFKILNPI